MTLHVEKYWTRCGGKVSGLLQMSADYSCVDIHTESPDSSVLYLGTPNLFAVVLQCSFLYKRDCLMHYTDFPSQGNLSRRLY
jgi:hypothetical protein